MRRLSKRRYVIARDVESPCSDWVVTEFRLDDETPEGLWDYLQNIVSTMYKPNRVEFRVCYKSNGEY